MSPPPTVRMRDLPPWRLHRRNEASGADSAPAEVTASVNETTRQARENWKALKTSLRGLTNTYGGGGRWRLK